ncbi:MAG: TrkH family potassium uptake protein [Parvibaculaceae bacterium]
MTYSTVLHALGWLVLLLAAACILPWMTALYSGEAGSFIAFSLGGLLAAFSGGALIMAFRDVRRRTSKSDLFLLVAGGWLVVPVFAAIPLYVSGGLPSLTDAYFEAVSGFTTTGASVVPSLDEVDRAVLVWRAVLQWLGGWVSIVMGAAVLAPLGVGGMQLRVSPLTRADKSRALDRFRGTAGAVGGIYAAFTGACFFSIWAGGIPAFDAFCLALSTVSTGGFVPSDAGLAGYQAPWALFFLVIFMIAGALNFATHRAAFRGSIAEYREDPELAYMLLAVLVGGILLTVAALQHTGDLGRALGSGLFTAVSLITTTGFVGPHEQVAGGLSAIFVIGFVLMGGATLSTAGGIKLMRISLLLKQSSRELMRLSHPHGIIPTRFGGRSLTIQIMKSVWAFFILFLVAYAAFTILLAATGLEAEAALVASAAALGNAGPAYDLVRIGDEAMMPAYAEMNDLSKWLLMAAMIVGRLELLALVALFSREQWKS